MSYIRSTTNPECLYIYGAADGNVWIHIGDASKYEDRTYLMPQEIWDGLCRKYVKSYEDKVTYKGATIENDVKVSDGWRTIISYKDWSIAVWPVTWEYVVGRYKS